MRIKLFGFLLTIEKERTWDGGKDKAMQYLHQFWSFTPKSSQLDFMLKNNILCSYVLTRDYILQVTNRKVAHRK